MAELLVLQIKPFGTLDPTLNGEEINFLVYRWQWYCQVWSMPFSPSCGDKFRGFRLVFHIRITLTPQVRTNVGLCQFLSGSISVNKGTKEITMRQVYRPSGFTVSQIWISTLFINILRRFPLRLGSCDVTLGLCVSISPPILCLTMLEMFIYSCLCKWPHSPLWRKKVVAHTCNTVVNFLLLGTQTLSVPATNWNWKVTQIHKLSKKL